MGKPSKQLAKQNNKKSVSEARQNAKLLRMQKRSGTLGVNPTALQNTTSTVTDNYPKMETQEEGVEGAVEGTVEGDQELTTARIKRKNLQEQRMLMKQLKDLKASRAKATPQKRKEINLKIKQTKVLLKSSQNKVKSDN
eukprot:TRINITY_DN838_c0_g1_i1.p1 TRINITY_DN838_c0_g1~~TRINITY_DN838_c0_g1_i1.p1  ORF type:complete len:139 (+),score=37.28 TRINITY_DN838_c0_g1_i1:54-470(+)